MPRVIVFEQATIMDGKDIKDGVTSLLQLADNKEIVNRPRIFVLANGDSDTPDLYDKFSGAISVSSAAGLCDGNDVTIIASDPIIPLAIFRTMSYDEFFRDLSTAEVAEELGGVSTSVVRRYIRTERIKGVKVGKKRAGHKVTRLGLEEFKCDGRRAWKKKVQDAV